MWDNPHKCVNEDVIFARVPGFADLYGFQNVEVLGLDEPISLVVGGHFACREPSVTYNFTLKGLGAVCRYCAGGPKHGSFGRYHVHKANRMKEVERSLPCERRDDLKGLTAEQIWSKICEELNICHTGDFYEPERAC